MRRKSQRNPGASVSKAKPVNGDTLHYSSLENRLLLASNVDVWLRGGNLSVSGDSGSNVVSIVAGSNGSITVTGDGTTINGSSAAFVMTGSPNNVTVRMGNGDDSVTMNGVGLSGKLQLDGGRGNDRFEVRGVSADQCKTAGGSGNDVFDFIDVTVFGKLDFRTNAGDDTVSVTRTSVGGDLKMQGLSGNDLFCAEDVNIGRKLDLNMGSGSDDALIAGGVVVQGKTQARLGSGSDMLAVIPAAGSAASTLAGVVSVVAGSGNDQIDFGDRVSLTRGVKATGSGGSDSLNTPGDASVRDRAFESVGNAATDGRVHQVFDRLQSNGIDAGNFGAAKLVLEPTTQLVRVQDVSPTLSVLWDRMAQQAVINLKTGPTVASRAYAMVHTAIYDAWSAYDLTAASTTLRDDMQRPASENTQRNKSVAMSFAAYRVLVDLFPSEKSLFDGMMKEFGLDVSDNSTDGSTPAGIGNRMAASLLGMRHADGSNQLGTDAGGTAGVPYSDISGYQAVNGPGAVVDIEKWTPERVPIDAAAGSEIRIQRFLTPQWGDVTMFGVASAETLRPVAPEPFLLVDGTVDLANRTITVAGGSPQTISSSMVGTLINPRFISQAEEIVNFGAGLDDRQKLIAEFWEDGGGTSFPPGTWMSFGQFVSSRDNHSLDEDAKMFFALGNAVMDAGIATWAAKVHYDYTRPVRAIRELGRLGLIGEFDAALGGYAITANDPAGGTRRILATDFVTYQTPNADVSPPFAEYTSGHSAFSASAAEILRRFTGSDTFGASVSFAPGQSRFEPGTTPAVPLTLAWSTFSAAADEAGISRLYGGIHFDDGDQNSRVLGRSVGESVWNRTQFFVNGGQVV